MEIGLISKNWSWTYGGQDNGRHFADFIITRILLNENVIKIWLDHVPEGAIDWVSIGSGNVLVAIIGLKPLSESMMA